MTNSWQDLLEQQNSLTANNTSASTNCFIPLAQLGVLHVSGEEAQSFLQNLLTNDVNALAINQSQLSGFCNAKGRLFAIFQLIRRHNYYQLVLPKTMASTLQQRLSMFVLRAKVTVSDESENMACMGFSNTNESVFEQLNLADDIMMKYEQSSRQLCIFPTEYIDELLLKLQENQCQLSSDTLWEQFDIEAGIPTIYPETKEKFTPQQVNLDLINGVSFSKGCYPGQEVVARLHYLGKPSRRMFRAGASTRNLPNVGEEITTETNDVAGHIVRVQLTEDNTVQLLLSLKLSEQENSLFVNQSEQLKLISP